MSDDFLWTEKYRPSKIDDTILPVKIKETLKEFVKQQKVPNIILTGPPGTGKTTAARAMLDEIGAEYIVINASLNRNIDTLRNEIANYASSVSFTGGRKYVILDESDYLNPQSFQPALRNFMEKFAKNCGFILTANFLNKIIEPLHSRCSIIEFVINDNEKTKIASQFLKRLCQVLEKEGVDYDKATLAALIEKYFPDWRRVINECQRYSVTGKIDSGILTEFREHSIAELVQNMKEKNFTLVRQWVADNLSNDSEVIFHEFYDQADQFFTKSYIPELVLLLAKYQYQASMVTDPEINLAAFFVEVMMGAQWK